MVQLADATVFYPEINWDRFKDGKTWEAKAGRDFDPAKRESFIVSIRRQAKQRGFTAKIKNIGESVVFKWMKDSPKRKRK